MASISELELPTSKGSWYASDCLGPGFPLGNGVGTCLVPSVNRQNKQP